MGPYVQSDIPCVLEEFDVVQITESLERNLRIVHTHFTNPPLFSLRLKWLQSECYIGISNSGSAHLRHRIVRF